MGMQLPRPDLPEDWSLLSASEVAHRLGISRVTVNNWRRQNRLLALQWDSHQYRYPSFQFAENPSEGEDGVVTGLAQVLRGLASTTNWGKVRFLLDSTRFSDRRTPLEILRQGDPGRVRVALELARADGALGA